MYACPTFKHNAIQKNKRKEKQTKQSFLINTMSSPPWYMHLSYGISLPLQMCTRNRISLPKNVHKSHIEMTNRNDKTLWYTTLEYTLTLFDRNRQRAKEKRGQKMKERTMIMMHERCKMNEKMKFKPKIKQSATKYKVNMTC